MKFICTVKSKIFILLALVSALGVMVASQTKGAPSSTVAELTEQLKAAPCKNSERMASAEQLFRAAGAADSDIAVDKIKDIQNLVVTKKGKRSETIIIGAHYDKADEGCGAIDNWTGLVIIANLYRTLRETPTEKTYLFVAFDKEEKGLLGSDAMAKNIPKESRTNYCSMVNLDSFGFNYP